MRRRQNVVDELVRSVTREILKAPADSATSLPPIRALAEAHGVTVPTAQRAIARLEELGLIDIKHGSGMKVLDPRRHANLAALPYWLDALRSNPKEARRVLSDFLELRAVLAVELLDRIGPRLRTASAKPLHAAIEALDARVQAKAGLDLIVEADLQIAHCLLDLAPQVAFAALWSSLAALLDAVPEVARAMYFEPAANVAGWRALIELSATSDDLRTQVLPLIREFDALTCDRFVKELKR
jgi:DNA-binding FadR family transcriptional regulator